MARSVAAHRSDHVDDLALSCQAELDLAWQHRQVLVAAAATLVSAAAHDPDRAACDDADCGLAVAGADPALCAAADRLARLPGAPAVVTAVDVETALSAFVAALVPAADAIRRCRQTAHRAGGCWFSATGSDGCGEILRVLHRCG